MKVKILYLYYFSGFPSPSLAFRPGMTGVFIICIFVLDKSVNFICMVILSNFEVVGKLVVFSTLYTQYLAYS